MSTISPVQDLIDLIIMKINLRKEISDSKKTFRLSSKDCYEKPKRYIISCYVIPVLIIIAYLPALTYILNYLNIEKNNFLFDYLKIINIDVKIYYFYNRMIDFLISIIPYIPVIVIFKIFNIIKFTDYSIILIYLIFVLFAINGFFFLMARKFKNQTYGMVNGIMTIIVGIIISTIGRLYIFVPTSIFNYFSV